MSTSPSWMDQSRQASAAAAFLDSNMETSHFFRPPVTTLPHWEPASTSQIYTNAPQDDVSSHHSSCTMKSDQDASCHSVHNGEHYDSFTGSGNGDDHLNFPITPPISEQDRTREGQSTEDREEAGPRRKRVPVPLEKKDCKYWDRRRKNNQAAKRSRDSRKKKIEDEIKTAKEAIAENQKLKQEIDVLKAEINSLRRLLKDANMTLTLWIRARQASEPNSQLPPMIRGPNLSFVNFPVTTTM